MQPPRPPAGKKLSARLQETLLTGGQPADTRDNKPGFARTIAPDSPPLPIEIPGFVLTELLARSAMSITFLGFTAEAPFRRIVVKIPLGNEFETLQRFRDEIVLLARLDHPAIVHVLGSGTSRFDFEGNPADRPWLAMEFIQGESLRQRINAVGQLPWREVRKLLGDVVEALEYLGKVNICHRDIKPDNIIFDPEKGRWVLVDFGIAKSLVANPRLALTLAGQDPGSWDYMSPEQLDGTAEVDGRTDIYSLGKTAWESLVGGVPRVGTPLPCAKLGDKAVPREVDTLIQGMVAHDPKDRYRTPAKLAEALEVGALRIEGRKKRRKLLRRVLRVAGVLLLFGAALAGMWYAGDHIYTKEAAAIDRKNKESPSRNLARLEQFLATHRYWGRGYAQVRVAELRPLADEERRQMIEEYDGVVHDLQRGEKDKEEYRLSRVKNFLKRHEGVFDDSKESRYLAGRLPELEQASLAKKELQDAGVVLDRVKELEAKGQIKPALDLCDESIKKFTTWPAKRPILARRGEVADRFIAVRLKELDEIAEEGKDESLVRAEVGLLELQQSVGVTPATKKRLETIDEKFWEKCYSLANGDVLNGRYGDAEAKLTYYLDNSRVKYHSTKIAAVRESIKTAEDDADWKATKDLAEKNIAQKAFAPANKNVDLYSAKWSTGRHASEAKDLASKIVTAHYAYLTEMNDLPDFNAELGRFIDAYPQETAYQTLLKRTLCHRGHQAINKVLGDVTLTDSAKKERLRDIDYTRCEPEKKEYLDNLVKRAREYLESDKSSHWAWHYNHLYERAPKDSVTFKEEPRVYVIRISSIEVSMSDKYYEDLKGLNNADPRVDLSYGNGAGSAYVESKMVYKILGPINTQNYKITHDAYKPLAFYLDQKSYTHLCVRLCDDDAVGTIPYKGVTFGGTHTDLTKSGKATYKWPDGTSIIIDYTSE